MANVLFGDATFEDIVKPARRPDVEVPAEILSLLETARDTRKRPVWPVRDEIHAAAMSDVLYAAGDKLGNSVLPAIGNYDDKGKFVRVKDWSDSENKPTHLRVTVGARRGKKDRSQNVESTSE